MSKIQTAKQKLIARLETRMARSALKAAKGCTSQAARSLHMDRSNFLRLCRERNLVPASFRYVLNPARVVE